MPLDPTAIGTILTVPEKDASGNITKVTIIYDTSTTGPTSDFKTALANFINTIFP